MARVESNRAEIMAGLKALGEALTMNGPGLNRSRVGQDVVECVADGIYLQTVLRQREPGGAPLAKLKAATLARKRRLGYPETIGVERHYMLAAEQLRGQYSVSPTRVEMTYGKGEEARKLAKWFQDPRKGRSRQQAPRPFYEICREGEAALDSLVDRAFDRTATSMGAE